ncbi:response regulator [Lachnospiraceae bacterium OttesenSCG-928-D06]|nr:response regulator [Lachnospiraceae bacterium OttesenSCG-928-D06]
MDYIKKIVIADDESIQREGLSQIITGITPNTRIYVCSNGEEAYEIVSSEEIDVLITDIRMPVMDGMDLIGKIRQEGIPVKIVLISAYQEFEYAKAAITYGVVEYLVKPFRVESVRNILGKINQELSLDIQKNEVINQYEQILSKNHQDDRTKELASVLNGIKRIDKLDREIQEELRKRGTLVLLRWKNQLPEVQLGEALTEIQQRKLLSRISEAFPKCYLIPLEKGLDIQECRIAVLAKEHGITDCSNKLLQIQNELGVFDIIFWCGISEEQDDLLSHMQSAMQQAEEVLSYCFYTKKEAAIFVYKDMCEYLERPMDRVAVSEKALREGVHKGDYGAIKNLLHKMEENFKKNPYYLPFKVKHTMSSMIMGIVKDLEGMITRTTYDEVLNDSYKRYGECDSLETLFQISKELLIQTAAYFTQETGQSDVVEDIIAYIKKHFMEEMTLQQLADRVHFSANYLSTKIKKRTGMTYTGYITSLRIEQAHRLLLQTDLKVVDIAAQCGFHDSSYFNRIFRRKYDTSPEQYRKVHKNVNKI